MGASLLERAAKKVGPEKLIALLSPEQCAAIRYEWAVNARPEQLAPAGNWLYWLLLAGRGFGKTRSVAEWARGKAKALAGSHGAIISPTAADARDVMVKALLACSPDHEGCVYEPSKRRIAWKNGTTATIYSAEEPDRLRGPQHQWAVADELAAWQYADEVWDMLLFTMRLGDSPQVAISTTPRPIQIIRRLLKDAGTVVTRGSTFDNAKNLSAVFVDAIKSRYEGTRLGRQELYAEVLEDVEGALWTHSVIEQHRVRQAPTLRRIVVAVDPAGSAKKEADETGIVVAGVEGDEGYVLEDLSGRYSPADMAKVAIGAYRNWNADRIVAEDNFGGKIIEDLIHLTDATVPYRAVHASRGKIVRAEPVAALYERGRVHHVGMHAKLEDELCFAAGTLVATSRGHVPIESVRVGDLAMTRKGWKRVTWSGQTGYSETVRLNVANGSWLECTAGHRIWVEKLGFVPCAYVDSGYVLSTCTLSNDLLLSSTASGIFGQTTVTSKPVAVVDAGCSIGTYGPAQTDQFPMGMTYTTSITTKATTPSPIWSRSPESSTAISTSRMELRSSLASNAALDVRRSGPQGNRTPWSAGRVEPSSPLSRLKHGFAGANAGRRVPVFDITVDEEHEFYANGILVHNCTYTPLEPKSPGRMDALVWAITDLMLGESDAGFGETEWRSPRRAF